MASRDQKSRGLTLIEMMLVIIVFAAAALAALKIIKSRAATQMVNTVMAQMQNTSQAVLTYYLVNNAKKGNANSYTADSWPTTSTTPSDISILAQEGYLSNATLCTPFPAAGSTSCPNGAAIEGQALSSDQYYQLVLQTNSASMAMAIASKLPNTTADGDVITMTLTPPGIDFYWNKAHGWIVSAGVVSTTPSWDATSYGGHSNSSSINLPNCGPSFEGHIIFSPFRYQTTDLNNTYWGIHIDQTSSTGSSADTSGSLTDPNSIVVSATTLDPSAPAPGYAVTVSDAPDTSSATVGHLIYFLTICIPVGTWVMNGVTDNGNNSYSQDGQCSNSWQQFVGFSNPNYYGSNGFCAQFINQFTPSVQVY